MSRANLRVVCVEHVAVGLARDLVTFADGRTVLRYRDRDVLGGGMWLADGERIIRLRRDSPRIAAVEAVLAA